ncbi:MutS protein msh4, partial [Serendipita sp. 405]
LGRGTSPAEGVGMAHAIAEELINRKCTVFFTTHFTDLSATLARYPTVVNLHLSVQRTRNNPSMLNLLFDYKICDGAPKETSHYGLELARLADFPAEIIKEATRVSNLLTEREEAKRKASAGSQITIRRKTLLNRSLLIQRSSTDLLSCRLACLPVIKLSTQLAQIHAISTLSDDDLARYLLRLQNDVGAELAMSFATDEQ